MNDVEVKIVYLLTYFDKALNERVSYLNNTGFPSIKRAEFEYEGLMKLEKQQEKGLVFSNRSKWAIEALDTVKKKRTLIKRF